MQINDLLNDPDFWRTANTNIIEFAEKKNLMPLVNFFKNHPENSIRYGSSFTAIVGSIVPGTSSHCMGFLLGIKAILDFQQAQEHSPSAIEIRELEKIMGLGNDPQI